MQSTILQKQKIDVKISINGGFSKEAERPYLDVIDNGSGIPEDIQEHIFDPFYTTNTEGTGLGLYITKEVIESNRAKIHYIAISDSGACFRIYFLEAPVDNTKTVN